MKETLSTVIQAVQSIDFAKARNITEGAAAVGDTVRRIGYLSNLVVLGAGVLVGSAAIFGIKSLWSERK